MTQKKNAEVHVNMPYNKRIKIARKTRRGRTADAAETYIRKMQRKIDSEEGRHIYSERLGTVEPVFGHLHNIGLNRFSLRGKKKVDQQWRLFCLVHNLLKIHRYAT